MDTRGIEIIVNDENESCTHSRYGGGGGGVGSGGGGSCSSSSGNHYHRGGTGGSVVVAHGGGGSYPSGAHSTTTTTSAAGAAAAAAGTSTTHSSIHPGTHPNARKDRPGSRRGVAAIHGADPSTDSGDENSMEKNMLWKRISRILLDDRMGDVEDREKVLNPEQPGEYRILKKVLNILFVTIGIALLLAVIVVVIYTAIGEELVIFSSPTTTPQSALEFDMLPSLRDNLTSVSNHISPAQKLSGKVQ